MSPPWMRRASDWPTTSTRRSTRPTPPLRWSSSSPRCYRWSSWASPSSVGSASSARRIVAQLIRPIVGQQITPALSTHLAGSGLALIGLEAEDGPSTLGRDALVSVAEDTIREVFSAEPELLENEMALAALTQDAFTEAVAATSRARCSGTTR